MFVCVCVRFINLIDWWIIRMQIAAIMFSALTGVALLSEIEIRMIVSLQRGKLISKKQCFNDS